MSQSSRWIKITVILKALSIGADFARQLVEKFESQFAPEHLYYAQYTSNEQNSVEISALTMAAPEAVRKSLKAKQVKSVKVENRCTGSLAHAYAYQAVSRIAPAPTDGSPDNDFLDVLHWFCAMRGLSYMQEAKLLSYRVTCLTHQRTLEDAEFQKTLIEINARIRAFNRAAVVAARRKPVERQPRSNPAWRALKSTSSGLSASKKSIRKR